MPRHQVVHADDGDRPAPHAGVFEHDHARPRQVGADCLWHRPVIVIAQHREHTERCAQPRQRPGQPGGAFYRGLVVISRDEVSGDQDQVGSCGVDLRHDPVEPRRAHAPVAEMNIGQQGHVQRRRAGRKRGQGDGGSPFDRVGQHIVKADQDQHGERQGQQPSGQPGRSQKPAADRHMFGARAMQCQPAQRPQHHQRQHHRAARVDPRHLRGLLGREKSKRRTQMAAEPERDDRPGQQRTLEPRRSAQSQQRDQRLGHQEQLHPRSRTQRLGCDKSVAETGQHQQSRAESGIAPRRPGHQAEHRGRQKRPAGQPPRPTDQPPQVQRIRRLAACHQQRDAVARRRHAIGVRGIGGHALAEAHALSLPTGLSRTCVTPHSWPLSWPNSPAVAR